jgi:uncharacterized protein (DUF736 family)
MTLKGTITRTDDNAFTGWIASLTFDVDIVISENPHKKSEKHPDFEITAKSTRNRAIRIGSAWQSTSQAGNDYLSVAINFGAGEIRANAVKTDNEGEYRFIPYAS